MTGMDLGSLLSDLVAAKKKMREKKGISVCNTLTLSLHVIPYFSPLVI